MFLVREEEVEEEREEILSLVCSQTNQEVKSVVFLFLQEKVVIFLVVQTSQLQSLTHSPQVCWLSYTISFLPKNCCFDGTRIVELFVITLYSFFHKRRQNCRY